MSDLRAEVANALYWDLAIPRYRVTSEVDHGLVTLQGVVERAYQRGLSKQKIPLRHRHLVRWLADQKLPVGRHVVGLRVDLDLRRGAIVDEALLAKLTQAIAAATRLRNRTRK